MFVPNYLANSAHAPGKIGSLGQSSKFRCGANDDYEPTCKADVSSEISVVL